MASATVGDRSRALITLIITPRSMGTDGRSNEQGSFTFTGDPFVKMPAKSNPDFHLDRLFPHSAMVAISA